MLEALDLPYVQRGLVAVLLLAVGAGLLGTWIVLRGLAFFTHAVGTATFPGLVLADGLALAPALGAGAAALLFALLVTRLGGDEAAVALVLAGALALGVVLASDVFEGRAGIEALLFGSLLAVDGADLALAGAAAAAALALSLLAGPRWLATGFAGARARSDVLLLALLGFVAVAALALVGALLAAALLVVPAATTRLLVDRVRPWQLATVALAAAEGVGGLLLAVEVNAPPGATIAVLAGAVFALAALWRAAGHRGLAAGTALLVLGGCAGGSGAPSQDDGGRLEVVATTTQLGDLARQVGGDRVEVRQLLTGTTDPHDYEPRPDDVRAVAGADVVLASGRGLDDWIEEVARGAGFDGEVVRVGEALGGPDVGRPHEGQTDHDEDEDDVHWWLDPAAVAAAATVVGQAVRADPAPYRARVDEVTRVLRARMDRIPPDRRKLVTDHDAFGGFARAFGLEVVGAILPSTSAAAQPSAAELARLAATVRREGVCVVFGQEQANPGLVAALADRAGVRVGAPLLADSVGRDGTVLGALRQNVDAVAAALRAPC